MPTFGPTHVGTATVSDSKHTQVDAVLEEAGLLEADRHPDEYMHGC